METLLPETWFDTTLWALIIFLSIWLLKQMLEKPTPPTVEKVKPPKPNGKPKKSGDKGKERDQKKPMEVEEVTPIVVPYGLVLNRDQNLLEEIKKSCGEGSLGLIAVSDVPGYLDLRNKLLELGYEFSKLPEETKSIYEHSQSHYSFGYSMGKEFLKKGVPDTFKSSFYANPEYDEPTTDPEQIALYPEVCCPNIWPREHLPALEFAFKELGQLITSVGALLAYHLDQYVLSVHGDKYRPENWMSTIIKNSRACKARLLHYFEVPENTSIDTGDFGNWCGTHTDHSSLTGLTSAIFRDTRTNQIVSCPDPAAGLYVQLRSGRVVKIKIPPECIAFQIGEVSQIQSGGVLRATMHAVRGLNPPHSSHICRDTFAVFMQPDSRHILAIPEGISLEKVAVGQYKEGQNFGEFGKATIDHYYNS
jgi:isopenicillin N synthase-like dioxygenase